ncbi:MAG: hypothetical protein IPL62_15235 [Caulobacteraceae bacterium]|nr:hypothetical protein [Caulobacteraceae bacterium]
MCDIDPPFVATSSAPFHLRSYRRRMNDHASQAIFAKVFYDLSDTLELSAGLRYDHQEVNVEASAARPTTAPMNSSRA